MRNGSCRVQSHEEIEDSPVSAERAVPNRVQNVPVPFLGKTDIRREEIDTVSGAFFDPIANEYHGPPPLFLVV